MNFSSTFFLYAFLPILSIYFVLSSTQALNFFLLIVSVGFYFWVEPTFCLVTLASAMLDYWLVQQIYFDASYRKKTKYYLVIGVMSNLSILLYYKYSNFFLTSLASLWFLKQSHFDFVNIILPIGVSFVVFEKITYVVDVYRKTSKPANTMLNYLTYVFFFPKLFAGPIIKYHEIESQLLKRSLVADNVAQGFQRFLFGLAKKVFIADACGEAANNIFALSANDLSFSYAWLGIISFTMQIYFDFSAYSDMAIGLAKMFGFNLKENFNMPYIATSFTDFWRRWHISLSTWIKEYLYVSLGGNRVSKVRTYFNLWVCFLLSGLWHGANWNFVIWGAYNGIFLVLDKLFWLRHSKKLSYIVRIVLTFFFVMLGWVIFRAQSFEQIQYYFHTLISPTRTSHVYVEITPDMLVASLLGLLFIFVQLTPFYKRFIEQYNNWKWRESMNSALCGLVGFLAICKVVGTSYTPFLYFRF